MSAVVEPLFTAERDGRQLRAFAAEAARWVRAARELGLVTIEATAERYRRAGELQEQGRGT